MGILVKKMSTILKSEYLYNDNDNHDKVYNVTLKEVEGQITTGTVIDFVVTAEYGRRGSVLKTITKYDGISYGKAKEIYTSLIAEKIAKGYNKGPKRKKVKSEPELKPKLKPKKLETQELNDVPFRRLDFGDL
jgi:predicted DNA-binding WGR domain protein